MQFNELQKDALIKIARKTLSEYLKDQIKPKPCPDTFSDILREKHPCFVTYKKKGRLRGCVGSLQAQNPLFQEVMEKSIQAAIHDRRFSPITLKELSDIQISITVLSSATSINSPLEFHPGKHGVILKKDHRQAVFLPQVALEQGWTREETLEHLAQKASLPKNSWQEKDIELKIFTAQSFSE